MLRIEYILPITTVVFTVLETNNQKNYISERRIFYVGIFNC